MLFNHDSFKKLLKDRKEVVGVLTQLVDGYKYEGDLSIRIAFNSANFKDLLKEVNELKDSLLLETSKEVVETKKKEKKVETTKKPVRKTTKKTTEK